MATKDLRRKNVLGVSAETLALAIILAAFFGISFIISASLWVSQKVTGQPEGDIPVNPIVVAILVGRGKIAWTPTATIAAALLCAVVLLIGIAIYKMRRPRNDARRVDNVSKYLGDKSDVSSLSRKNAEETAARWFPAEIASTYPGFNFGRVPGKKTPLYSTWEDLFLIIFGPRMGKTTTQVIPAIFTAPGPVVTTSNKRDLVDDTIKVTSARGNVWVFDPQDIAHYDQEEWFFDPLDSLRRDPNRMDTAAIALADIFRSAAFGAKQAEDFWVVKGRDILARLFLAAAVDNRPITDAFGWVNDMRDTTPVNILDEHPEWQMQAEALRADYATVEETRSGLFTQGQQMAAPLGRRATGQWVTPRAGARRFSAEEFVRSRHDTLYLLSKEGPDNAAALTSALVAAVMQAAERYGEECGGRLPVPLVAPLDEAANTVRWPELPKLYSHYGSRSIILMTILQSYTQGVSVWGEEGMEALWSAASIVLYGGGVRDQKMLEKMEALIGEAAEKSRQSSTSQASTSISTSYQEKKILTVSELASLEAGRAVAFITKRRPLLIETVPFFKRQWQNTTRKVRR